MNEALESFETIDPTDLERTIGGVNWVKIFRAVRDGALELWSGSKIERIEPRVQRPTTEIIDPRPPPKPPELPNNVKLPTTD